MLWLLACTWIGSSALEDRLDLDRDGLGWPEDCDDADASVQRSRVWYLDADGDGYGHDSTEACEAPGSAWVEEGGDCDDGDAAVRPGATEACNDRDDDCDGEVDNAPIGTWYADEDEDGWGDRRQDDACPGEGWVEQSGDCDDQDPEVHPGVEELCNGLDDDCNGSVDDSVCAPLGQRELDDFARWDQVSGWGASVAVGLHDGPLWGAGGGGRVVLSTELVLTGGEGFGLDLGFVPGQLLVLAEEGRLVAYQDEALQGTFGSGLVSLDTWQDQVAVGDASTNRVWLLQGPLSGTAGSVTDFSGTGTDALGAEVGLCDLDDDGAPELLAGAPGRKNGRGAVFIYDSSEELTRIDGDNGAGLGVALACGDLDGDGGEELAVGAATSAWLFLNPLQAIETADAEAWVAGPQDGELGASLALPDLDGDDFADLAVGVPGAGSTWLAYGPHTGALTWMATLDGPAEHGVGRALAGGDLDQDGFDDLLLGLPGAGSVALVPGGERP